MHRELEILESIVEVHGDQFLDLLERLVSWKLSYLGDLSTTEVGFNRVLAQRKHVILWLLAAKEGCLLTVCSWATMIIRGQLY